MAKTLAELRAINRWKQRDVANKTGIPFSTYVAYELGYRKVPVERAKVLADFYGVRVEEIEFIGKEK